MSVALLFLVAITATVFAIWSLAKRSPPTPKLDLPYVRFDGDNSPARYKAEYGELLSRGYNEVCPLNLTVR
jgi:hypothetical protein